MGAKGEAAARDGQIVDFTYLCFDYHKAILAGKNRNEALAHFISADNQRLNRFEHAALPSLFVRWVYAEWRRDWIGRRRPSLGSPSLLSSSFYHRC